MTKDTHTMQDVEALILEKVILLKTAKTKEEKEKLRKQIQKLEKHFNDCNDKHINGKKYPVNNKTKDPDDEPMNKKEIYKLIDSVGNIEAKPYELENLSGLFTYDTTKEKE